MPHELWPPRVASARTFEPFANPALCCGGCANVAPKGEPSNLTDLLFGKDNNDLICKADSMQSERGSTRQLYDEICHSFGSLWLKFVLNGKIKLQELRRSIRRGIILVPVETRRHAINLGADVPHDPNWDDLKQGCTDLRLTIACAAQGRTAWVSQAWWHPPARWPPTWP